MTGLAPVLVLGATSGVGEYLLRRLGKADIPAIAVSRRPPESIWPRVTWVQQDLDDDAVVSETSMIFGAGPLHHVRAQVAASPRAGRVVALTSATAIFERHSGDRAERAASRALVDEEAELEAVCRQRHIGLTLFRPTMIYGGRAPDAVDRLAGFMQRLSWVPACGRGLRQPVHADDLAEIMLAALRTEATGIFHLGGGETLSYPDMLRRIAAARGRAIRLVRLPAMVPALAVRVAHLLGRARAIRPAGFRRQAMDLVVDDTPARERLEWQPRPFRP